MIGLTAIGIALASGRLVALFSDPEPGLGEQMVLTVSALAFLVGFGLLGVLAGALIRAAGERLDREARHAETETRAVDLLEQQIVPALDRLTRAIEQINLPSSDHHAEEKSRETTRSSVLDAIQNGDWVQAESLAVGFARAHPGDSEAADWLEKANEVKRIRIEELKAHIDAARQVGDPEQVLASHDELVQILDREERQSLDREVASSLLSLIHKKLRTRTIGPELALLAGRVADRFAGTTEGASLRSSLPVLRRSAGLCPRCVEPYTGVAEACPRCLGHDSTHDREHWPEVPDDSLRPGPEAEP